MRISVRSDTITSVISAFDTSVVTYISLWILKPWIPINTTDEDPERFYLMWRNVYTLYTNILATFDLSILRMNEGEVSTRYIKIGNEKRLISIIIGLTNDAGKPFIENRRIYDLHHGYIVMSPYDTCPTCNEPFNNPTFGMDYRDSIYRFSFESYQWRDYDPNHYFIISGNMKITL